MVNLREALELWLQVTQKTDGKAQMESQRPHQILENRAIQTEPEVELKSGYRSWGEELSVFHFISS